MMATENQTGDMTMKFSGLLLPGTALAIVGALAYFYMDGWTLSDGTDLVTADAALTDAEADDIYRTARASLIAGYQKGDNEIADEYPDWKAASTLPARPGVHSGRYMMTYVNDIGHEGYVEYGNQNVDLPIGTKIAKESFKIKEDSGFFPAPLFTMEKMGDDIAPDTDGWFYGRVNKDGRKMGTSQKFCHSCHEAFSTQDSLGYPVKRARFGYVAPAEGATKAAFGSGDVANGATAFQACASCHQVGPDARNAFGPVLNGIIGREAGSYPGYRYSDSLAKAKDKGLVWDEQHLFEWLEGPSAFLQDYLGDTGANSKMPIEFEDAQTRNDVIAYLRSQSGER